MWKFNKEIPKREKMAVGVGLTAWTAYLLVGGGKMVPSTFWPVILASNAVCSK